MVIENTGKCSKRNEPCSCDSGLKFKHCHGDPQKLGIVKHIANEVMLIMIAHTKRENENIDFGYDEYAGVVENPEWVLPKFIDQFEITGEQDAVG